MVYILHVNDTGKSNGVVKMLNLIVFETEEELCELTGLIEKDYGTKGLILMIGRLVSNRK